MTDSLGVNTITVSRTSPENDDCRKKDKSFLNQNCSFCERKSLDSFIIIIC